MIRAVCPDAVSDLKTGFVTGWNIAPNIAYTITVVPGASSCAVWLFDAGTGAYLAGGAALVGTDQPVTLLPATSPGIGMVDADLGYHLLVTTDGTEDAQTYGIGPFVDWSDQLSAMYTVDDIAVVQASAVIREGTHYTDDASILCPLGVDAWLGDVVAATVYGETMVGDIESASFQASPSSMADVVTVRRMSAILPDVPVVIVPPVVTDDAAETDAVTATSGNVLTNDASGLTIVAVDGLESNVGIAVAGAAGGVFTIAANGAWTFDPGGDFATLSGSDTAETSVTYHASNGEAEGMATLTVTVSSGVAVAWTPADISTALWADLSDVASVVTSGVYVQTLADKSGNSRNLSASSLSLAYTPGKKVAFNASAYLGCSEYLNNFSVAGFAAYVVTPTQTLKSCIDSNSGTCMLNPALGCIVQADQPGIGEALGINGVKSYHHRANVICAPLNHVQTVGGIATVLFVYSGNVPSVYINGSFCKTGIAFTQSNRFLRYGVGPYGSFSGDMYEHVLGLSVPSAEIIDKIFGYLGHKWDAILGQTTLVDALPASHPYKTAPPTV